MKRLYHNHNINHSNSELNNILRIKEIKESGRKKYEGYNFKQKNYSFH